MIRKKVSARLWPTQERPKNDLCTIFKARPFSSNVLGNCEAQAASENKKGSLVEPLSPVPGHFVELHTAASKNVDIQIVDIKADIPNA
jgi:hypothetical protein